MKTTTYKNGDELCLRVSLRPDEVDRYLTKAISEHGPGLCRHAAVENCRPLFETPDRTYEIRLPAALADDSP